jgi:hypothetical protein
MGIPFLDTLISVISLEKASCHLQHLGTSNLEMRDGSTGGDMAPPEKHT